MKKLIFLVATLFSMIIINGQNLVTDLSFDDGIIKDDITGNTNFQTDNENLGDRVAIVDTATIGKGLYVDLTGYIRVPLDTVKSSGGKFTVKFDYWHMNGKIDYSGTRWHSHPWAIRDVTNNYAWTHGFREIGNNNWSRAGYNVSQVGSQIAGVAGDKTDVPFFQKEVWQEYTLVFDEDTIFWYVDGNIAFTVNISQSFANWDLENSDIMIGARYARDGSNAEAMSSITNLAHPDYGDAQGRSNEAVLDNIQIYDAAMTAEQVMASYKNKYALTSVTIDPEFKGATKTAGKVVNITHTYEPTTISNASVSWSVTNDATTNGDAAINANGTLVATSAGTVTIRATADSPIDGSVYDEATITFEEVSNIKEELLVYYPFDGDASDSSGNNIDASAVNSPTYTTGSGGKYGEAVVLERASEQYLTIDNALASIDPSSECYSLLVWAYLDADNISLAYQIASQEDGNGIGRVWAQVPNDSSLLTWIGGGDSRTGHGLLNTKQWHHIALTYNLGAQSTKAYIDGVFIKDLPAISGVFEKANGNLRIGNHKQNKEQWNGMFDEFILYNRLLSETEINTIKDDAFTGVVTKMEKAKQTDISIYPNPAANVLYFSSEDVKKVQLFNISGQMIMDTQVKSQQINTGGLSKGVYLIKLMDTNNDLISIERIAKQ